MRAAIALGSNLSSHFGDRSATLREAVRRLGALGDVLAVSGFFETTPVGFRDQPDFLNAAALLETELAPEDLLHALMRIELAMGRDRAATVAKGPRVIDLDLLLCEDPAGHGILLETPHLTLPHPALHERAFVLRPLAEIAPGWRHPVTQKTVAEMLAAL